MTYELEFSSKALKEFDKLSPDIAGQFLKKLEKVLENPRIPKNKLHGAPHKDLYKIKLRSSGFRLLYEVNDIANKLNFCHPVFMQITHQYTGYDAFV